MLSWLATTVICVGFYAHSVVYSSYLIALFCYKCDGSGSEHLWHKGCAPSAQQLKRPSLRWLVDMQSFSKIFMNYFYDLSVCWFGNFLMNIFCTFKGRLGGLSQVAWRKKLTWPIVNKFKCKLQIYLPPC